VNGSGAKAGSSGTEDSMLQRLGLEIDRFASSTGTMRGLEMR